MPIFRSLSIVMVMAILINAMAPTLVYAAIYLQGPEVNADTLIQDAYVVVTYYDSKNKQKSEKAGLMRLTRPHFGFEAEHFLERRPLLTTKCCQ